MKDRLEDKFFGLLYRSGPENASDTQYMWRLNQFLTKEQEREIQVNFVRRYDDISGEQAAKIEQEVGKYHGPQNTLIQKIGQILADNNPA